MPPLATVLYIGFGFLTMFAYHKYIYQARPDGPLNVKDVLILVGETILYMAGFLLSPFIVVLLSLLVRIALVRVMGYLPWPLVGFAGIIAVLVVANRVIGFIGECIDANQQRDETSKRRESEPITC